jgi:NDP-sugar pyrophosphorylase family protein
MPSSERVVLLAGGRGTRLRPFTMLLPKALVPVGEMPILEILVRQLRRGGFTDLVVSVGYLGELIEAYFHGGRSEELGVRLSFVRERAPLGTAGCLRLVPDLAGTFLVVNADLLTTLDFRRFVAHHRASGAVMTIAATERRERLDWGVIETTPEGRLTAYVEKPERAAWISMGIYACEPAVLPYLHGDETVDIPELAARLLADGLVVEVYRSSDYWLDLGNPQDYTRAVEDFAARRGEILHTSDP